MYWIWRARLLFGREKVTAGPYGPVSCETSKARLLLGRGKVTTELEGLARALSPVFVFYSGAPRNRSSTRTGMANPEKAEGMAGRLRYGIG